MKRLAKKQMKIIDGLNYRDWQKRNTAAFTLLSKSQQTEIRKQGYKNQGWKMVVKSWQILCQLKSESTNVLGMFEHKLKQGDIAGAIAIALVEAESAQDIARETIDYLNSNQKKIDALTESVLDKYPKL